jgi:hypothetical protein
MQEAIRARQPGGMFREVEGSRARTAYRNTGRDR